MDEPRSYRLFITPHTKIEISKNEKWMFSEKITWDYLLNQGRKKRARQIRERKKRVVAETCFVARKKYILTYLDYKREVCKLFYRQLKEYPTGNLFLKFYIPMPKSWSHKKRNAMCFTKHQSTPDVTNLIKAFEDSCCNKQDKQNWDVRGAKFWIDLSVGFIEIHIDSMPEAKGFVKVYGEDLIQ